MMGWDGDGTRTVEAMNPQAVLGVVGDSPVVHQVAQEAIERLRHALDSLAANA